MNGRVPARLERDAHHMFLFRRIDHAVTRLRPDEHCAGSVNRSDSSPPARTGARDLL